MSVDGFRSTDAQWQREIDSIITELLAAKNVKHNTIRIAPNSTRVIDILKILKLMPLEQQALQIEQDKLV